MPRQSGSSGPKPAALFLAPEAPYPAVGGGPLRSASVVEYLARRHEVDVIVFREPGAPDPSLAIPARLAREVRVIELPHHSKRPVARIARNAGRLFRSVPPLNDRFGGFDRPIEGFLRGRRYEVAVIEHFWCAPYWEQVAAHCGKTVLDLHNVESSLLAACAEAESWGRRYALRRFQTACMEMERQWLPRFDLLMTASQEDAARARKIAGECRIVVYPNALPRVEQPMPAEEDAIVFSGNLEYHPNVSAVKHFRREIWPLIRDRQPGTVWRLVGKNPHAIRKIVDGDPRIEIRGPVDDAVAELATARLAVVPVQAGSGTRVKILEAWAAGRAVVSTAAGAEGLAARHNQHLILADRPAEFAAAVLNLLESGELRRKLGAAGRALYEAEFTWESAWDRLEGAGI